MASPFGCRSGHISAFAEATLPRDGQVGEGVSECVAVIQKRIEPGSQQPEPVPQQALAIPGTRQPAAAPKKGPRSDRARQLAGSDHTRYQQLAPVRGPSDLATLPFSRARSGAIAPVHPRSRLAAGFFACRNRDAFKSH